MEIKVKNTLNKNLQKDYHLTVPNALIKAKINDRIAEIQKDYSVKGFRKGQVPVSIIQQKHGDAIKFEELDKMISSEIKKIINDNNLKIAIEPKADLKKIEDNADVECTISFELMPEVPNVNLDKIKVSKIDVEISDHDTNAALAKFLKMYSNWNKQEPGYKSKVGDMVNIDYVGKIDGKEFAGGSAKNHNLELGTKSFIDNFEDQLVNKQVGDEIKVKVKFPDNYHNHEYSSKNAVFEVKINSISVAQMPETSDEFIKNTFGLENKEKLVEILKKQVENNYQNLSNELFKKEVFDFFAKNYDFDLPNGLIELEFKNAWNEEEANLKYKDEKAKSKAKDEKLNLTKKMVRVGIIISNLATKHQIEVTKDDLNKEVTKVLAKYPGQEKNIIDYYQKNRHAYEQLRAIALEDKIVEFIAGNPNIKKKTLLVKEFDEMWQKQIDK
jgi:trigger factor